MTHSKSISNKTLSALALAAALAFASTSTLATNHEQDHTNTTQRLLQQWPLPPT